ncbi:MAG: hypothetical protein ACE5HT_01780 [Gemmatimonadales bacterium]
MKYQQLGLSRPFIGLSIVVATLFLAASCRDDSTGPQSPITGYVAIVPVFQSIAASMLPVEKIRITLTREDSTATVALDTVVALTAGQDSVDLSITVQLTDPSEVFLLRLALIDASQDTVFRAGPIAVTASTSADSPQVTQVPLTYTGPGSNAATVVITTANAMALEGQVVTLQAEARDTLGQAIPGTPIRWNSLDTAGGTFPDDKLGAFLAGSKRGTVPVVAQLLTGPADTASVMVQPRPSSITKIGDNQTAAIGSPLPLPVGVRLTAADGLGVEGALVVFAAAAGNGSLSGDSVLTDTLGIAQVSWILGGTAGPMQATARIPAINDTTVTLNATAQAATVRWTNPAGGNWSNPANWDLGVVPGAGSTVIIDLTGTYTVTLDVPTVTLGGLTLGGATGTQTLALGGNALAVMGTSSVGANATVTVEGSLVLDGNSVIDGSISSVTGGALTFASGTHTLSAGSGIAGTLAVNFAGGAATVSGSYAAAAGTLVMGGTVNFNNITAPATTISLTMSAGTLGGPGDLAVSTSINWTGGTWTGGGDVSLASTGTAILGGGAKTLDARGFFNSGTATWTAGDISSGNGSVITNPAGAIFDIQGDVALQFTLGGTRPSFVNNGTLRRSVGTGLATLDADLNNTGTVNVQSGTLAVSGTFTHGATATLQGAGTFQIPGDLITGGTVTMPSGQLSIGGVLTPTGTFNVGTVIFARTGPQNQVITDIPYNNVEVQGPAQLDASFSVQSGIAGNLVVSKNGALDMNSTEITVNGDFITQDNGVLIATFDTSYEILNVLGNIVFGGGSIAGLLTDAEISVAGNFTQTGTNSPESFHAGGNTVVIFNGNTTPQTISFENPGIGPGVALSHFAHIQIPNNPTTITLASDVFAHSNLTKFPGQPATIIGNGHKLAVGGLSIGDLVLDHVLLEWNGTPSFPSFGFFSRVSNVSFVNYSPGEVQFNIVHPGALSTYSMTGLTFATAPTRGVGAYVRATDSDDPTVNQLNISLGITSPATCSGADFDAQGGAILTPSCGQQFTLVGTGRAHSCAIDAIGRAYCWGDNTNGQLGDGTNTASNVPVPVSGGLTFTEITAGGDHSCGITTAQAAYCWGRNTAWGQLGDGTTTSSNVPVLVSGGGLFANISAGNQHTCGVLTTGQGYCWGRNTEGQLGDGTNTSSSVPVPVAGQLLYFEISASKFSASGRAHTCGVTTADLVYCWGDNTSGQLGDGTNTASNAPVAVAGGLTFDTPSTNNETTCAGTLAGGAYCWGNNANGQLGNGSTTNSNVPVVVSGNVVFDQGAATGSSFACGATVAGAVYCWGDNSSGQLGDGTTTASTVPVQVVGGLSVGEGDLGTSHACVITGSGAIYCWGRNFNGQLGDGTNTDSSVPVLVSGS